MESLIKYLHNKKNQQLSKNDFLNMFTIANYDLHLSVCLTFFSSPVKKCIIYFLLLRLYWFSTVNRKKLHNKEIFRNTLTRTRNVCRSGWVIIQYPQVYSCVTIPMNEEKTRDKKVKTSLGQAQLTDVICKLFRSLEKCPILLPLIKMHSK